MDKWRWNASDKLLQTNPPHICGCSHNQHCHLLTLRAQLTKSSNLVMTYSPLLLATDAGLAAATAVLFSLTGTTLQHKKKKDLYHVQGVCWVSVLYLHSSIFGTLTLWWYSRFLRYCEDSSAEQQTLKWVCWMESSSKGETTEITKNVCKKKIIKE